MPLAPGHRLGPYQILGTLGAGGMGEVYRARDTTLGRDVAIKVLPDVFATDPERLARLTREARALAALSHPNIAHVHGLDDTGSGRALVMELVEGEDLADRIARGPIPAAEAVPIARQIAEALEAAHEHGIVHRDLKPANIRIRHDGAVKVLDFGLAKPVGPASWRDEADAATFTAGASEQGVVVGSAAYMAPEQARGRAVDKRADIWAFGAVLYEMLTGTRAFNGEGFSDILGAVLRNEVDWTRLPAATPARVRHVLERCLTTDPRQRLRDIGEARIALAAIERDPEETVPDPPAARSHGAWRERIAWAVAGVAVVAAVLVLSRNEESGRVAHAHVSRVSVLPPAGRRLNPDSANVAISPDGRMVALVVGRAVTAENQLWVRSLDSPVARRIESGDGVSLPFWSPDSTRIGFFAAQKLKVVDASGGPAVAIGNAPFGRGGTWNGSNVIVFAPDAQGPLYRVSVSGGTPAPVTRLDPSRNDRGHRFPFFLPDGDRFLYTAVPGKEGAFDVFTGSLQNDRAPTRVGSMDTAPVYAAPGWLLFARQGVLAAQRFDARTLQVSGDPVSLGDQPGVAPEPAALEAGPRVSAAANGSLAYYQPVPAGTTIQWMDPTGTVAEPLTVPEARYVAVALAPDGTRAVLVREDSTASSSLWLVDLSRGGAVPLATEGRNVAPVWSPDSTQVVFASERRGHHGFYVKTVADASPERRIAEFDDRSAAPRGWSNDGAWILYNRVDPGTQVNVYRMRASGAGAPEILINGPGVEIGARTSPDGNWLAYMSDETGRLDVFVRSMSPSGPKLQVSTGGVQLGWWTRDGRELRFLKRDQTMWRVPIDLRAATPRLGTAQQVGTFPPGILAMDLARDGRFLAVVADRADSGAVTVVQSWQALVTPR